jgi:hypothetical protein
MEAIGKSEWSGDEGGRYNNEEDHILVSGMAARLKYGGRGFQCREVKVYEEDTLSDACSVFHTVSRECDSSG